jgi:hypothetical protein
MTNETTIPALTEAIKEALAYGNMSDDFLEPLARSEGMTLEELKECLERYRRRHRS